MRDPRTLGPYAPQRPLSLFDLLQGASPATAMAQAAQPPPSLGARIAGTVGGGLKGLASLPFLVPANIAANLSGQLELAPTLIAQRKAELEARQLANQRAAQDVRLSEAQYPAQAGLAAAQARQQGVLDEQIGRTSDPRLRDSLIRGAATGVFRPFEIEPGPAELAAYENVLGMTRDQAREELQARNAAQQARLEAGLQRQTTRERLGGELELERQKRALGPQASLSDIGSTQQRYLTQSQDFIKRRDSYSNILFAAQDDTGASDLTLLYNFIRMQDPNAVREGELALTQQTSAIADRWIMQFNKLKEGDLLPPGARAEIIAQSRGIFRNALHPQLELEKSFGEYAVRNGLRPEDVTLGGALIPGDLRGLAKPTTEEIKAELARRPNAGP